MQLGELLTLNLVYNNSRASSTTHQVLQFNFGRGAEALTIYMDDSSYLNNRSMLDNVFHP